MALIEALSMLTVWSMCTGSKYPFGYVTRLQREVGKYLTLPHRFVCITEHDIPGVECMVPPADYPGWFGKIGLFKPGVSTERNLWLDLDVVITGNLDELVKQYSDCNYAAPANWAVSGWGGIQSSVMLWKGGKGCHAEIIYRMFDPSRINWPPISGPGILYGDQEWCTELRESGHLAHTPIDPALIKSYKYHCRDGLPPGCLITIWHGDPKPADVKNVDWFTW